MENLTPEFFNGFIIVNIIVGVGIAGWRFYRDLTTKSPPQMNDAEFVAYLKERQAMDTAQAQRQADSQE